MKLSAIVLGTFLFIGLTSKNVKAQYDDVSLQTFYDELSPYGTWIKDPQYGYVWRPDVDQSEFRPYYSNGRWAMTEYGNTWVSDYDWGWAPFHYGRWIYTRYNRWIWIPDTVWGPAWVNWRSGGGYYGWAPMGPSVSVNINIGLPDFYWNFISVGSIYHHHYPRYYSGRNRIYIQKTVIINNTYINNNRTYYTGPRIDDIRKATHQNVTVYNISRTTNRTGSNRIENNNVNIYTPRPNRGSENVRPVPQNVTTGNVRSERINFNTTRGVERTNSINENNTVGLKRGETRVDDTNLRRNENSVQRIERSRGFDNQNSSKVNVEQSVNKRLSSGSETQSNNSSTSYGRATRTNTESPVRESRTRQAERIEVPQRSSRTQEHRVEREASVGSSRGGRVSTEGMQRTSRGERPGRG